MGGQRNATPENVENVDQMYVKQGIWTSFLPFSTSHIGNYNSLNPSPRSAPGEERKGDCVVPKKTIPTPWKVTGNC